MGTIRKLIVEVVEAHDLMPKDGQGTSSPYAVVDFHGQRKRTQTAIRTLTPSWNEVLEFKVNAASEVFGDELEIVVYHDRNFGPTRRNNCLGKIVVNPRHFVKAGEEALVHYALESKSFFSWVRGEIGLKIYLVDEEVPPPPPPVTEKPKAEPPPPADPPKPDAQKTEEAAADAVKPDALPPAPGTSSPLDPPLPDDAKPKEGSPPAEKTAGDPPETNASPAEETSSDPIEPPPPPGNMQSIPRRAIPGNFTADSPERYPSMEKCSFDLVDKMHYIFVRIVKARSLPISSGIMPVVKIAVAGSEITSKPSRKTAFFEWDQTFAFARDAQDSSSILEVSVWDPHAPALTEPTSPDVAGDGFLGGVCYDTAEIPLRDPPDSQLAPQWYRLEGGGAHHGDLMLATWIGTQADEAFPDAWKTDTAGNASSRAKIYLSPKLWYLRATVIEAQDILPLTAAKELSFQVEGQLGFQVVKTKPTLTPNGSPSWNEDLLFVASEPLSDHIIFFLETRQPKGSVTLGAARIPLTAIERRVDDRQVASRWFSLEDPNEGKRVYMGRVHLRLCFDGGYHVMDEPAHVCSDYRPTARQLWKPPIGTVELGIIGCRNLLPMKAVGGTGSTDAYSVAKYGPKWVRTRTVSDSLDPKWNEQYTWKVFDPCTVLTVGVFDSWGVMLESNGSKEATRPDCRIGKVRIRISTLEMGRVYRNTYPLLSLTPTGLTKTGDIELAIRFLRAAPTLDVLHVYSQPLLPLMHHIKPLGVGQQDLLRNAAVKFVALQLSRSEPPLRREVVLYMLDADSHAFSMRKVRANWHRIINVVGSAVDVVRWIENTRSWRNPTATILVHALFVLLVWFPDLIIPTLAFYVFSIGAWNYRFRVRDPLAHFCPKTSMAETVDRDELDEEFDVVPTCKSGDVVRMRYDKLRVLGTRVQTMLGDFATQAERVQALVTWRDPRGTAIFVLLCFAVALILYMVPSKMVAMASGFYYLRHPMFRDRMPSPVVNFFRRLPSLSDRVM